MFFGVGELGLKWFLCNFLLINETFLPPGGLVLASIDQVPEDLIDNAIVLGCLSFFVAFIFLIDMSEKMGKRRTDATQTDTSSIDRHNKSTSMTTLNSQANLMTADANDGRNRDSMRSQRITSNPFHEQMQQAAIQDPNYPYGLHSAQPYPTTTYAEDVVETQTLPSAQLPVFSKVKQPPAVNHFETEPYKKILSRTNQPFARYQDQAHQHQHDPSFYDDFNNYRKQTYYQGPKVDQEKLVIRDYSKQPQQQQQQHACNCQNHQEGEVQDQENLAIKSGYVSQVAKLWDNRMKSNQGSIRSHQRDIKGLNTVV